MIKKLAACMECGRSLAGTRSYCRCLNCHRVNEKFRTRARNLVARAIRAGELPSLAEGGVSCVDCGRAADRYDHRDYSKPLSVDPVCRTCNRRRGPGVMGDLLKKAS